ncbi:MAG: hypothetical protein PUF72_03685 [Clostridiales bacterium]|nr:hypothetical protein [Clostridiales bacterium]
MKRRMTRLLSTVICLAMTASVMPAAGTPGVSAAEQTKQMEYLTRGLTAVRVDGGVYLSWRLLGTESLSQTYDIYRDGKLIISGLDATNYTDTEGFAYNKYRVVKTGESAAGEPDCEVWQNSYIDIPLNRPEGGVTKSQESYTYSVNDTSVGDVDGDGEYEYIIKWDPSNSKDNSSHGYTGNVLLDCYKMDGTQLWRIDLGINIRAGAHYTQFIVYDLDGDGKAEMALRTTCGSKDGNGNYVSAAGSNLTWGGYNDGSDLRQSGSKSGHIIKGPDWLTVFNGETGAAMKTVDYYPQRGSVSSWGDSYGGRSERYLAGVAYLDGATPSLIMCRGYYEKAAMAAWKWDGSNLTMQWGKTYTSSDGGLYAQGNHQLSVADVDEDGCDEVIFGSAVMDNNGTVLNRTGHGHGDALHVSDFNNDGEQEIFQVHEESTYYKSFGAELRKGKDATILAKVGASADVGRGVIANVDDEYAAANTSAPSLFWSVADEKLYDFGGNVVTRTVTTVDAGNVVTSEENAPRPASYNFFIYWDGDLGRELLDRNRIEKYTVENGTQRLETFSGVHYNNSSKATPALSADIMGDWREEVLFGTDDNKALRIYMSTTPTDYKLTTLMHDSQYRCAVAWQNVGYNQPPHQSYYIGSTALASGKNYLAPAEDFDTIKYAAVPSAAEVPDMEETVIYDVDSFNSGTGDFTGGSISAQSAPYNNTLYVSAASSVSFGLNAATPDPNATPTPSPSPTPKPAYTQKPIATNAPVSVYENDFNSLSVQTLVHASETVNQENGVNHYTQITGLDLMTGYRSKDASSTNWSVTADGEVGNVIALNTGKYSNANRGPRISFNTPQLANGETAVLSIKAKLYSNGTNVPAIRYNDSTTAEGGTDISEYFSTSAYTQLKVTITNNGGSYTRTIYAGETAVASDTQGAFPVIWGAIPSDSNNHQTGIFFDDFSVSVIGSAYDFSEVKITDFAVTSNRAAQVTVSNYTDAEISAELYIAVYNTDDTLCSVQREKTSVNAKNSITLLTNEMTVPDGGYIKAFIWNGAQQAYDESISTKTASVADMLFMTAYAEEEPLDAGGTYRLAFDWKPGTNVKIINGSGDNLITLSKATGAALKYRTGTGEEKTINTSLTSSNSWFHIDLTFDFTAKTVDISASDYTNNGGVKTVYSSSFAGVDGFLGGMEISGGAYIDNVTISSVTYNVQRSLINIYAKDSSGAPVEGAAVTIGSKSLTTDTDGHAAIKLNSASYAYSVGKAEYKTAKGTVDASNDAVINAELKDGELRNIYVRQVYNGDVVLSEPALAGEQKENTVYTVPDSAKGDVSFTFPSGSATDETAEDIIPGYEDEAGKTYIFEYDPNHSETVDVNVEEGADTYITLAYTKKRVPAPGDTEVLKTLISEDGVGRSSWSALSAEFMTDEETGTKYTSFANVAENPVTISFNNTSDKIVFEYDIMYKELDFGGNYFGFIPMSGTTEGLGFGIRTSGSANNQWQWGYYLRVTSSDKEHYLTYADGLSGDKGYTYSYNWQNQWAHVIVICDGTQLKVTAVNKNTGLLYVKEQPVPLANNVGTSSYPINKVKFGLTHKGDSAASCEGTIGLANFKAYTIGSAQAGDVEESAVNVKPTDTISLSSAVHVSDIEGVDYDASTLINATYELQNESGETVSPDGISIDSQGTLTTALDSFDGTEQYWAVVKYNGTTAKKIKLNYLAKSLVTKTYKGFGDGGTGNFSITSATGFSLSNDNGTLKYYREPNTAVNSNVYIKFPFTSATLDEEFWAHLDMKSVSGSAKGYLYLYNGVGNQYMKSEVRLYEPRIKWYYTSADSNNWSFTNNEWYTYVFHGTNMSSGSHNLKLIIYKTQELWDAGYVRQVDGIDETAIDLSNVTGVEPVYTLDITPYTTNLSGGMYLQYQPTQSQDKGDVASADELYFDNVYYQYYDYR